MRTSDAIMQAREEIIRGVLDIDDIKLLDSIRLMIAPARKPDDELTDEQLRAELREAIRWGRKFQKGEVEGQTVEEFLREL